MKVAYDNFDNKRRYNDDDDECTPECENPRFIGQGGVLVVNLGRDSLYIENDD